MELSSKHCSPIKSGMLPLFHSEAMQYLSEVREWKLSADEKRLVKEFEFKDFKSAFDFAGTIAAIAEAEDHHPDLSVSWGKVGVSLSTHSLGGLSENDFIIAARIDQIPPR